MPIQNVECLKGIGVRMNKNMFLRNGFITLRDSKKKIYVNVNENVYSFGFETNTIYEIPTYQIRFAICIRSGKRILFINKNYISSCHLTSPYRTFYNGLMKEPFKFCYPFDEEVIIETEEGYRLNFRVIEN